MRNRLWWRMLQMVGMWFAVVAPRVGVAQSSTSTSDALNAMTDRAGVVFLGTVSSIRHIASDGGSSGAVEITFAVEQAVKGCTTGSTYALREWAGLWMANDARYRVGQRLLMLLHAPGPGGLSGPVDGMNGAIPVYGTAPGVGPDSTTAVPAAASAVADLRWVAAGEVVRPLSYVLPLRALPTPVIHGGPLQVVARVQGGTVAGSVAKAPAVTAQTVAQTASERAQAPGESARPGRTVPVSTLLVQLQQREVRRGR